MASRTGRHKTLPLLWLLSLLLWALSPLLLDLDHKRRFLKGYKNMYRVSQKSATLYMDL